MQAASTSGMMRCSCERTLQQLPLRLAHRTVLPAAPYWQHSQLARKQRQRCSSRTKRQCAHWALRATKEEQKRSTTEPFDVEPKSIADSEVFGLFVKVLGLGIVVGAVALLLFLARPLIDNTLSAFPGQ